MLLLYVASISVSCSFSLISSARKVFRRNILTSIFFKELNFVILYYLIEDGHFLLNYLSKRRVVVLFQLKFSLFFKQKKKKRPLSMLLFDIWVTCYMQEFWKRKFLAVNWSLIILLWICIYGSIVFSASGIHFEDYKKRWWQFWYKHHNHHMRTQSDTIS